MTDSYIERRIVIGFIISKEFLEKFISVYRPDLLKSKTARILTNWCIEFFNKYNEAPQEHIQDIYWLKLKEGLDQDTAEWIEEILEDLSDDYDISQLNIPYLSDETDKYFRIQSALNLSDVIKIHAEKGEIDEAEAAAAEYHTPQSPTGRSFNLLEPDEDAYHSAFESMQEPVIKFPGALGEFLNDQLIQTGFVGFLGVDKVGKTFLAHQLAIQAVKCGNHVALFEVGDMTENDMRIRHSIYLTKKSDMSLYCGEILIPVLDCAWNQLNICKRSDRKCNFGIFEEYDIDYLCNELKAAEIKSKYYEETEYIPCRRCATYGLSNFTGAIWYKKRPPVYPLKYKEALRSIAEFHKKYKRVINMAVYATGELRPKDIENELLIINKKQGYMPKVVIVDYPQVMEPNTKCESERLRVSKIWTQLRGISQKYQCLLIAMLHADSGGYGKKLLDATNFSESKTVNAVVTAMIGLNMDNEDEEKGILRMNKILIRRGKKDPKKILHVLRCLEIGRPFINSYF